MGWGGGGGLDHSYTSHNSSLPLKKISTGTGSRGTHSDNGRWRDLYTQCIQQHTDGNTDLHSGTLIMRTCKWKIWRTKEQNCSVNYLKDRGAERGVVTCVIVASTDTLSQSLSVATCGAWSVPRSSAGGTHIITGKAPGGHILDDGQQGLAGPREWGFGAWSHGWIGSLGQVEIWQDTCVHVCRCMCACEAYVCMCVCTLVCVCMCLRVRVTCMCTLMCLHSYMALCGKTALIYIRVHIQWIGTYWQLATTVYGIKLCDLSLWQHSHDWILIV